MRALRAERGYTVVEFVFVSLILAVVLAATLTVLDKTIEIFPKDQERAHAVRDAQVGLAEITRELRQAYEVHPPPAAGGAPTGSVTVDVALRSMDYRITFDCGSGGRCVRSAQTLVSGVPTGTAVTRVVLDRVLNGSTVFTRATSNFMKVRVEVPATAERDRGDSHNVVLDDGVLMRNAASG